MKKKGGFKILYLILAWAFVLVSIIISLAVMLAVNKRVDYDIISIIIAFSSFVATSFFGISIFNHNASIREQNTEIRRQTASANRRAELFRNLQFIASNYTIIDFIDYALIYEESDRYIKKLKDTKALNLYLLEQDIDGNDIFENFESYLFLTLKLPIKIIEGKSIGRITFSKIKFEKENSMHRFVAFDNTQSTALLLYNENDKRQEVILNLITKKNSDFYKKNEINPFIKIKLNVGMESLLGVVVNGTVELYFTNPEKIERSGANKYKINSSQFELIGKPKLNIGKEYEPD